MKTRGRKKKKLDTEDVKRMSPIIETDTIIEDIDIPKNPEVPKQADDSNTPIIKRKRKLYSAKDDHVVNEKTGVHVSETEEDTIMPDIKIIENTPKSLATSYKEIESLRRRSIRKLCDRKSRSIPSLSARTKKNNEMFDSLKKTTEGEKVKLASRKTRSKQYAMYIFTSDSDDDDFKIRMNMKHLTKKTSTNNVETVPSRCTRSNTKVNYSEVNNDSTEELIERSPKLKYFCQGTKKINRENIIVKLKNEMIDERMRVAASEKLNTSIIIEPNQEELNVPGPEPILKEPQMEVIADKDVKITKKKRSNRNKTEIPLKKSKPEQGKMVLEINSDRDNTESPLSGLIIETMQENRNTDGSISDLILEKFKDIDQEGTLPGTSGLNNTQNLLSDINHNNNSPPNLNIPENFIKDNESQQCNVTPVKKVTIKKTRKRAKVTKTKNERKNYYQTESLSNRSVPNIDVISISDHFKVDSEKTIATVGKSPITGHGDFDELPPSVKQLSELIQGRGLETQDLNQSMKAYFDKLMNEINEVSNNSSNANNKNVDKKKNCEISPTNSTKNVFENKMCDVKESGKTVKRKSSLVFKAKKLRKIDDKNSIESLTVESGPSSSSVQDWLRRNEREKLINTAESLDLSMKSNLENIIEKLDTTLIEIHHKTSKEFVNMFVDIQKHLNKLKDQRHQMFSDTAKEVMSEVVKVMNDKFEKFDKRSQELDEQFIENPKLKAQNQKKHMKRGRNPDVM